MAAQMSATEMLARLVAFDSTSRNANLPLIDFVQDYLDGYNIPSLRVDYDEDGKTNLYATIGPDIADGIVLSGHTDVVPVDGQDWSSDPFRLREDDGKLYGRGTCDMKGFIAVALAMAPHFAVANLKKPIHFAFSCDEETGCMGVRPLIKYMSNNLPKPAAVLVGEPSLMQVVNGHKGTRSFTTEVTGHEAHSSCTHHGVNAISYAGEAIGELNRLEQEMCQRGDVSGRFDPPYTTLHIGTITGGTANNIIPRKCSFDWELRLLPDANPDEVLDRFRTFCDQQLQPRMQAVIDDTGISTSQYNATPALTPEPDSVAELLALHLAQSNDAQAVSYATEAGLFQNAGIPTVICGPGSIEQAHKPDEFVAISELEKCTSFMHRLIGKCS